MPSPSSQPGSAGPDVFSLMGQGTNVTIVLVIVLVGAVVLAVLVAWLLGVKLVRVGKWFRLEWGKKPKKGDAPASTRLNKHEAVFRAYAVAAEGMLTAVADRSQAADQVRRWVDEACSGLTASLANKPGDCYRVAVWLWRPKGDFQLVGRSSGVFHGNRRSLPSKSIAGVAIRSDDGVCCSEDVHKDARFNPLGTSLKAYKSLFAIALWFADNPRWGVLTVDGVDKNAFDEESKALIVRYGDLISAGIYHWFYYLLSDDGPDPAPPPETPPDPDWKGRSSRSRRKAKRAR
jgi:hypothetical protein